MHTLSLLNRPSCVIIMHVGYRVSYSRWVRKWHENILLLPPDYQELYMYIIVHISTHETVLMIPAKTCCPTSWTREYYGYLMYQQAIIHLSMSVLTEIKSLFLEVMLIPMVHYSITLRPTVMACPALLMMPKKSSTVLVAPNKTNTDTIITTQ